MTRGNVCTFDRDGSNTRDMDGFSGNIEDLYKAAVQSCESSNVLPFIKPFFDVTHRECEAFAS